jgi:hypothetical protein
VPSDHCTKETLIPALSSMFFSTKFKGSVFDTAKPIATIYALQNPTISSMPAWVTVDKYKNCIMVIDNCAPYDIVIARNKVLGILEFVPDDCIPMTENSIAAINSDIQKKLQKYQRNNSHEPKLNTNSTSKTMSRFTANNLKFQKLIKVSLRLHLMSVEWSNERILYTICHCFVFQRNKAKVCELYKILES